MMLPLPDEILVVKVKIWWKKFPTTGHKVKSLIKILSPFQQNPCQNDCQKRHGAENTEYFTLFSAPCHFWRPFWQGFRWNGLNIFIRDFSLWPVVGNFFFHQIFTWLPISHPVMEASIIMILTLKTYIQGIQKDIRHLHTSTTSHTTSLWRRENIKWHIFCKFSTLANGINAKNIDTQKTFVLCYNFFLIVYCLARERKGRFYVFHSTKAICVARLRLLIKNRQWKKYTSKICALIIDKR